MADSKPSNDPSTSITPDNDLSKTIDSHTKDIDEAANILIAMSSDRGTPETEAEVRTLEHAAAQGAPAPLPMALRNSSNVEHAVTQGSPATSTASITLSNTCNIAISIEDGEVVEGQTAHTSTATVIASLSPTSLMTSDARTTSAEVQRGIVERVVVTPERTILAGRIVNEMTSRQREKQPAGQGAQAVETEQEKDHNDLKRLDTQAQASVNVERTETTTSGKLTMAVPTTDKGKGNSPASEQGGDVAIANAMVQHTRSIDEKLKKAVPVAEKGKGKAPNAQQTRTLKTIEGGGEPASLRGGALPRDDPPSAKPSIAPYHGAQTTTAQHFLKTTANPETAENGARRAHLNEAYELARSIRTTSVKQVGPLPGFDFAIWDGSEAIAAHQRLANQKTASQSAPPAQAGPSSAANTAQAAPHTTFSGVYIHTAKCDSCNGRNQSVLYRCHDCTTQICRACMETDPIHSADGLDWTNHGAQSASKPRVSSGIQRQRKMKVEKPLPKSKPRQRGQSAQQALIAQSRVGSGVARSNSPRTAPAGTAAIHARARRLAQDRLAEGTDGADDEDAYAEDDENAYDEDEEDAYGEDDVTFMGESSRYRDVMGERSMGIGSLDGRPASGLSGGSSLGKRSREPAFSDRSPPRDFRPIGASIPYAGSSNPKPPQPHQPNQDGDEVAIFNSFYDRYNRTKEAQAEKERPAKKHKGPVKRGNALSRERIFDEDEDSDVEDEAPMVSKTTQRPKITFRTRSQTQSRTPPWAHPIQNAPAQVLQATRSASPVGMRPDVDPFLARIDQVRSDYTRMTQKEADLEEELAQVKAEKAKIKKGASHLMK